MTKTKAIIVDIDGTLSDGSTSNGGIELGEVVNDLPILATVEVIRGLNKLNYHIIILTSRKVRALDATKIWLSRHNIPIDTLIMKSNEDNTAGSFYKMYKMIEIMEMYDVVLVLDDDPIFIDWCRTENLIAYHVAPYLNGNPRKVLEKRK